MNIRLLLSLQITLIIMHLAKPATILAPYVKQYWGIEGATCPLNDYSITIVPTGLVELDFYLGTRPAIVQAERDIADNSVLNGQQKQGFDIHITDKLLMFSVIFQPAGAMLFFDMPLKEVYNQNVPLKYFMKAPIDQLEDDLYKASDFQQRTVLMNEFLLKLLAENYKKYAYARIENTIQLINNSYGAISIDELAANACLSRKQFERTFLDCIGSTPKQFLRTIRFQFVLFNKMHYKTHSLTELAHKCGYYDQSHMITDFKHLTGMTPKQYFSNCDLISDYFS